MPDQNTFRSIMLGFVASMEPYVRTAGFGRMMVQVVPGLARSRWHALDGWTMWDDEAAPKMAASSYGCCAFAGAAASKAAAAGAGAGQAGGRHSEGALLCQRKRSALVVMDVSKISCLLSGASRQIPTATLRKSPGQTARIPSMRRAAGGDVVRPARHAGLYATSASA